MIKNVFTRFSLLAALLIFVMSACSTPRYSHTNNRKTSRVRHTASSKAKKTRKSRSTVAKVSKLDNDNVRSQIVKSAEKFMGIKYVYGGKTPSPGFDCSGFTSYVYQQNGIPVKGASHHQAKMGKRISKSKVEPGDLIFFGSGSKVSHVAIVKANIGDELEVIHSTSSAGVRIDEINGSSYWNKRYLYARQVIR